MERSEPNEKMVGFMGKNNMGMLLNYLNKKGNRADLINPSSPGPKIQGQLRNIHGKYDEKLLF